MPTEIQETGVTWDHDTGEIWVSTRKRSIATKLIKAGFEPIYNEPSGYTSFKSNEDLLGITIRRRRRLSASEREAARSRMKKARESKSGSVS